MLSAPWAMSDTNLQIKPETTHDVTVEQAGDAFTFITTGGDPYVSAFLPSGRHLADDETVLTFDYRSTTGLIEVQIFFAPQLSERRSVRVPSIKPTGNEWSTFTYSLRTVRETMNWGTDSGEWYIRLDFGNTANADIAIRNLRVRPSTTAETLALAESDADLFYKKMLGAHITGNMLGDHPCKIEDVTVTERNVIITGFTHSSKKYLLAEVMPYEDATELKEFCHTTAVSGKFTVKVPRIARRDGFNYDRMYSKWMIVSDDSERKIVSHLRYAGNVAAKSVVERHSPPNRKGMLGVITWQTPDGIVDIDTLNCGTYGMGITMNQMFHLHRKHDNDIEFNYLGHTYYADGPTVKDTDKRVKHKNAYNAHVLCYVRCYPADLSWIDSESSQVIIHPQCNGGYQCAMNIANAQGFNIIAAGLNFIMQRYSTAGMRIHVWAAQNEVNANREWCNLGDNNPEVYFSDYYTRLMRVMRTTAAQYDQHAPVLAVFEHNWAAKSGQADYPSLAIINHLVQSSKVEGDFLWGIGAHPYPANQPDFWRKDTAPDVTSSLNSPKVTFKNLEVLNDWILNPCHFYQGKEKRPVYLCENGISSMDNSEEGLTLQAAAVAWAWKKFNSLEGIDSFLWYSPFDYGTDFGLQLGLRFPGSFEQEPYRRKPAWWVWEAAGTDREDDVFRPYLDVVGLNDWAEITSNSDR